MDSSQIRPIPDEYRQPAEKQGSLVTLEVAGFSDATVYLPYGYADTDDRYDTFYLLHGGGGDIHSFFAPDGELKNLIDNMIARGDMKPLIIVAPTYYPPNQEKKDVPASAEAVNAFGPVLRSAIIPAVDAAYRTIPAREHRAIGGFSMGSVTTWNAVLEAMDLFRWFMPQSGDCWKYGRLGGNSHAAETAKALADAARGQDFYIHAITGSGDIACPNLTPQMEAMKAFPDVFRFGDNTIYSVLEGGVHDYPDIRRYIYNVLPEFFR